MKHDKRLVKEEHIEEAKKKIPEWVKELERPSTPMIVPEFGPLSGARAVISGTLVAAPFAGELMAELGAEVIYCRKPGRGSS